MSLFNGVENIVQWHKDAVIESISVLGWVKKSMVVPNQMYTLSNSRGPYFTDNFVEADGSDVVEVVTADDLGGQLNNLVSKPAGTCTRLPDALHVCIDELSNHRVPRSQHTGCGF